MRGAGAVEIRSLPPELRIGAQVELERARPWPRPAPVRRLICGHDEPEVGPSCVAVDRNGVEICTVQGLEVQHG